MRKVTIAVVAVACAVGLWACGGAAEIRIDETKGVPPVKGTTEVNLASFTCGSPIAAGDVTVKTTKVAGGCELSFDQQVPVLKASDYTSIADLKNAPAGTTNLVQRVELTVKKLALTDATSGAALDLSTRVTSATFSLNGQQLADKSTMGNLPKTISLAGDALAPVKAAVEARQAFSVAVKVVVVLPDSPAPPAKLGVDYDAQPAIILGAGTLKL